MWCCSRSFVGDVSGSLWDWLLVTLVTSFLVKCAQDKVPRCSWYLEVNPAATGEQLERRGFTHSLSVFMREGRRSNQPELSELRYFHSLSAAHREELGWSGKGLGWHKPAPVWGRCYARRHPWAKALELSPVKPNQVNPGCDNPRSRFCHLQTKPSEAAAPL